MHKVTITIFEYDELNEDIQKKVLERGIRDYADRLGNPLDFNADERADEIEEVLRESHYLADGTTFLSSMDNQ